ncbi:O-antigen ligase family protein [Halanaerobacter jeridensis]|uniref:Inorganic carbon (HCO3(-)) transporter n=1 Tax=Halanaerobacter jeridensis TaxID=706427 RepID=A0A938XU69_9FIRM|nr:O-antigen ligase family protein [Halanaerobacter jeridensis]MBM7557984.1 putative inorganic carbon (HCO3(-)) transporter [Halanaerobacter jeridensis]
MFNNLDEQILDRISLWLLIAIIVVVPLLYLPQFEQNKGTIYKIGEYDQIVPLLKDYTTKPKFYALLVLVCFLLIIHYMKIKKKEKQINWRQEYLPLVLFLGLVFISALASPYKNIVIYGKTYRHEGLLAFFVYGILFFSTISIIDTKEKLKKLFKYLFISAVVISIIGLIQYCGYDLIKFQAKQVRAESTLGNPDFAGSYVSMLFPLSFVLFFYAKTKKELWFLGTVTTIFYAFLVATGTRSAYVALLAFIPLVIYLLYDKLLANKKRLIIIILILSIVTVFLAKINSNYSWNRFLSLFLEGKTLVTGTEEEIDKVGSSRMYIYKTTVPLLLKNPLLGSGPDTFQIVYPQEKYREFKGRMLILDKAHSEYLQLGVTLGIPALIAYLWFLFVVLKKTLITISTKKKYQIALFLAVISYLVQATFNISVIAVAPVFWILLGLNFVVVDLNESSIS